MSFVSNLIKKYKRATPKQLVLAGVFMLACAGAIGGGLASQQSSFAAVSRDTNRTNSIDNSDHGGGIGAISAEEFISDAQNNNPNDLRGIYDGFGLQPTTSERSRFLTTYRWGTAKTNGDVIVDGQKVMTGAWSIGRTPFSYSKPLSMTFDGKSHTYYKSMHTNVLKQDLPVMVLFDNDGTVEFAVIGACGNPVEGNKVKSGAKCEALNSHAVSGKKNTYQFSATASKFGLAQYVKFNYYVDGKLFDTTTSGAQKTKEITLTKTSKVKVEIEISLPSGKKKTVTSTLCEREIKVEIVEKFTYACDDLYATTKDNLTFRLNAIAKHSSNVKLVSADFTLDGSVTTKGVTQKNDKGEIYKDYTFNDEKAHTVSTVINFEYTQDGVVKKAQSKELCKERVTPKKPPVCKYNPNLPPNHPDCKKPECKPGIPVGDDRCEEKEKECKPGIPEGDDRCKEVKCEDTEGKGCEEEELPSTGPAGVASLFAGVTAAGAVGHRVLMNYRARREQ